MSLFIFEALRRRRDISQDNLAQHIFELRRLEAKDLSAVCEIENLSFSNPWPESAFIGEIHNLQISFPFAIIHRVSKKLIGYILYWHIKEEVQISNFAIHPDFRRKGLGEAVLKIILKKLHKQGAKFIFLEVRPSNTAARSLYKKLEFQVLKIRKNYYSNPLEDALIMGKHLVQ